MKNYIYYNNNLGNNNAYLNYNANTYNTNRLNYQYNNNKYNIIYANTFNKNNSPYNIIHTNTIINKNNNCTSSMPYNNINGINLNRAKTVILPYTTNGPTALPSYVTTNNVLVSNNRSQTRIVSYISTINIDNEMINLVLSNTVEKYFVLKDFLELENEKDILNYFNSKEEKCFEWLDINFPNEDKNKQFFINLIMNSIQHIYDQVEEISKPRKSIKTKINDLIEEVENTRRFNNLEELYEKYFDVKKLPKFLKKEITKKIDNIQYLEKYNNMIEKQNNIYEINQILVYYNGFITGSMKPFNSGYTNEYLLMILLYSNLKDIYKSYKVKRIFIDNYNNILNCFNIISFDKNKYFSLINNINLHFNENEALNMYFYNYQKIQNAQINLYTLSSYFYLMMNRMRDTSNNNYRGAFINFKNRIIEINLNNPFLNKILMNVINNFVKYCPNEKLSINSYHYLFLLLYNYIVMEDNNHNNERNHIYNISEIQYIINKSLLPDVRNKDITSILTKINNIESPYIEPPKIKLLSKIKQLFFNDEDHEKEIDKINLSPLNLKIISNTITILISGFGSESENIYSWRHFIDYESKFSSFYFYKWPSGNFGEMISIIPFSNKFILEFPQKFINYKLKAKLVGKILGLFLASNEEFKKFQINLVGFSLGCHVIKCCLKEMYKIKGVRNMINNVLFLAGATTIKDNQNWKQIVQTVVGGRIINVYSSHDLVLSKLFKFCVDNTAIGTKELIIKDENNLNNIIENYDVSDLKLGHLDYRKNFSKILKKINFY